jgi:hypothetical protein
MMASLKNFIEGIFKNAIMMPSSHHHDAIKTLLKNFIGGIFKNAIMMPS